MCEIWNSQTYIYVINHPLSQVEIVVRWIQDYVYGYGSELNLSYDIDLHDSIVKSDTWNINDYKGASLLWGKDAKPPLVIVCPDLLLQCSALHPQQGQAWRFGEHIIAIWTSIFESDGTDNLKQGTLWRSTHDDCWCATQGMRNKSKESTNILTIIRTYSCWYNTTMSGAFTPAPKSCLYTGKR
jgi:hypothetical protein